MPASAKLEHTPVRNARNLVTNDRAEGNATTADGNLALEPDNFRNSRRGAIKALRLRLRERCSNRTEAG